MERYYVHYNGAAVFVKEAEFFKSQGGMTAEWGNGWRGPVEAESIEDARAKGYQLFGVRRTRAQELAGT